MDRVQGEFGNRVLTVDEIIADGVTNDDSQQRAMNIQLVIGCAATSWSRAEGSRRPAKRIHAAATVTPSNGDPERMLGSSFLPTRDREAVPKAMTPLLSLITL
jgi:hypothetical protein